MDDGLAGITLSHSIDWLFHLMKLNHFPKFSLDWNSPSLTKSLPDELKEMINLSDLVIKSNPLGKIHQKQRWRWFQKYTLDDRKVCVIKNYEIVGGHPYFPLLHPSVKKLLTNDPDYHPDRLKDLKIKNSKGYTQLC